MVEVDTDAAPDPILGLPLYRIVDRRLWLGVGHASLYGQLVDLAHHWRAAHVVVDATGIGAGLAQFLARALGPRVVPVTLNAATKSSLGWRLQALVDTGRLKDYADDARPTRASSGTRSPPASSRRPATTACAGACGRRRATTASPRAATTTCCRLPPCAPLDDRRAWGHAVSAVAEAGDTLADVDAGGY
ncbi:MAG: hypothetical protein KIS91_05245 [Anaerolineae bacterium]|nr:hypothetical protein [Anaerolineae bacterium]